MLESSQSVQVTLVPIPTAPNINMCWDSALQQYKSYLVECFQLEVGIIVHVTNNERDCYPPFGHSH